MNLYPMITKKLARDPTLIDRALTTLDHWAAIRAAPVERLVAWRRILMRAQRGRLGMEALLRLLRDDSEASRRMKDFGPFAGILTRGERRRAVRRCIFDH